MGCALRARVECRDKPCPSHRSAYSWLRTAAPPLGGEAGAADGVRASSPDAAARAAWVSDVQGKPTMRSDSGLPMGGPTVLREERGALSPLMRAQAPWAKFWTRGTGRRPHFRVAPHAPNCPWKAGGRWSNPLSSARQHPPQANAHAPSRGERKKEGEEEARLHVARLVHTRALKGREVYLGSWMHGLQKWY